MGAALDLIKDMEAALGRSETDLTPWFHDDFTWTGNTGCGVKHGLAAFRQNWSKPFRAAFHDRSYRTERFLEDGAWVACFGKCKATHGGTFMGIAPTGKRVEIPYIDFWHVMDGKIADNRVNVDFPHVLAQLGVDVFDGHGWETFDRGARPLETEGA